MGISKIRGEQIKSGVLLNEHIASNAAIAESKLNIDWLSRYHNALKTRKILDYVQVNGTSVGGFQSVNISSVIPNTVPAVDSTYVPGEDPTAETGEGVVATGSKNKAIIRNATTGEPILDANENEVYGRVSVVSGDFTLSFYTLVSGVETAFTMPASTTIDWQYVKRFNLDAVSESFAMNEKFVDGVADATSSLNILQLAKDIYGNAFTLDRDGNSNLETSIAQQIANEISARQQADTTIRDDFSSTSDPTKGATLVGVYDIDNKLVATTVNGALIELADSISGLNTNLAEDIADVQTNLTNFQNDLNSDEAGKGASLVKVEDNSVLNGTTVQDVLENIEGRVDDVESELSATLTRDANTTNSVFTTATYASLEARLESIESTVDAKYKEFVDVNADGRLDDLEASKHDHFKGLYQASGYVSSVSISSFGGSLPNYTVANNSLDVYVNGLLQNEGLHYGEVAGGASINFDPTNDGTTLSPGDIVTIIYHNA